jgi:2-polyprenyl-6-methoxyphenol hydroxylase-like FAD-dependent oxidoreductase
MTNHLQEASMAHALVLGGSIAGLLAARALSDFYDTVTVVERDDLPETAVDRRGVPQGRQVHGLLLRGARTLEDLLPGILDELVDAGARVFDGQDLSRLYFCMNGHLAVRTGASQRIRTYSATRPFLECHVRNRVRAITNVTFATNHDVVELTASPDGQRITGARVADRASRKQVDLSAALVVDATGRGSRTPTMLGRMGYQQPIEECVTIDLVYRTQRLRMSPESLNEQGLIVSPVPGRLTGIVLAAAEQNTWMLAAFGMAGAEPPKDFSELCGLAEELLPAHVAVALRGAECVGDIVSHHYPSSRWRRYDKTRLPGGLLVVGDAVCSFNPIYGQGITVAALHALALRECLSRGNEHLAQRFFRAAAKPTRLAWQMAVGGDLALPEISGTPALPTRLFHRYVDRVLAAAEHDVAAFEQFVSVAWLVDSPLSLLHPSMMWRALTANQRRPADVAVDCRTTRGLRTLVDGL